MSWKIPKSLEEQSAYVIAYEAYRKIIAYFVEIFHPQNIPSSRIFKADERQLIRFEKCFEEIVKELAVLRRSCERIGFYMEKALEYLTDEATIIPFKRDFYIPALILKLRISMQVCTDKDFDYHIPSFSVPPHLEYFTKSLIHRFENNCLKILIIYKYLDRLIPEQILCSSRNITYLNISVPNITSELLISVGKICVNLRALHLSHVDLWSCVTVESLYLCFFKGYSSSTIASYAENNLRCDQISFPYLQYTTIAYDNTKSFIIFHRCLLLYYKNLESLYQNWMLECVTSMDFHYTRMVLTEIADMQHIINLRSLVLNIAILSDMLPFQFLKVLKIMPFLNSVYIDCYHNMAVWEINHNLQLLWKNSEINEVHLKHVREDEMFNILNTIPEEVCKKITSITFSRSAFRIEKCLLELLFLKFSFLQKIKFSEFSIPEEEIYDCELASLENLVELHIRNSSVSRLNISRFTHFIRAIVSASPNLELFSVTVDEKFLFELTYIEMPVLVLHISFPRLSLDTYLICRCVINFVYHLRHLKTLYLEEIGSESFFMISRHFRNSNLIVKYGGLHGLPRMFSF